MFAKVRTEMSKLDYVFKKAPILIGGGAMEYYGMRTTGHDFDFIISCETTSARMSLSMCMGLRRIGGRCITRMRDRR